jgi:hypothetical protein
VKHIVLVCGGRDYSDYPEVSRALRREKPDRVVTGDCPTGADRLALLWCQMHPGVEYQGYPADWKNFQRAAGPMRNAQMLAAEEIDLVLAFPGGRGTADMVRKAKAKGIPVRFVPTANADEMS